MQESGNGLTTTLIVILMIALVLLISVQWIWLNGYFKKKRSIEKAERGRYIKYYVGRGGTGFIGVHKHSLTIFKDVKKVKKIPYEDLYIYRTKNRFDFKENSEPLTMMDRTYGVILSHADTKAFKEFIEENKLNLVK
ncbi:hypothetical protein RD055328_11860 [Companilactobacillus sp. RD055328]|uniref:hypothetical protein n=1 Tax=Companilactobacillus sp. RD055328 TaxID=2916634 RepID=UPI001FC8CC74|nr:hypothetical protein [Companilactobacillus sp. RD055328]GKQ43263.1 hypothetical protein RD055328_11860 [Companilactobacillus sp. RD055328]